MHFDPAIQHLLKNFYHLLSTHSCIVLPFMLERKKFITEIFSNKSRLRNHSITIFDLKTLSFDFHNSSFNHKLKLLTVCKDLEDPMAHLTELTEPANREFCLDTMIKSYIFLMNLPKEAQGKFKVAYVRRLLEKDGRFHPYLHCMYVSEFDEEGNPWLITIETIRLRGANIPVFRYFSPVSGDYTEEHEYSLRLLNLKLNEKDIALLNEYRDNCKGQKIVEILKRSKHTVSNYYTRINKLFDVHSIQTSSEIAEIMDILQK
jgi:hypothetical protein